MFAAIGIDGCHRIGGNGYEWFRISGDRELCQGKMTAPLASGKPGITMLSATNDIDQEPFRT